ncbi:NAD(P)-binding protein [Trichoderma aethiopicum]
MVSKLSNGHRQEPRFLIWGGNGKPTHVLNAAGCTGRPNVDWCEDNKPQTVRSNAIGTLNLADACFQANIHCTIFATGCIYQYDKTHPIGGRGYTEEDRPNFEGSFYSLIKGHVEPVSPMFEYVALAKSETDVSARYCAATPTAWSSVLFKDIVRPELSWQNFTLEEQAKVIKAGRSNCALDTTKLVAKLKEYQYEIPEVHEAYEKCFERMKAVGIE